MNTKLRSRFVLVIFAVMFVAGAIAALCASFLLNGRINNNIRDEQVSIAEMMLELAGDTDYSVDDIIKICQRDPYAISRTNRNITGGIQFSRARFFMKSETMVSVRGENLRIHFAQSAPMALIFFVGIIATALAAVLLGTVIAGMFSNQALKPIHELSDAIARVAQGDFSVRVSVPTNRGLQKLMVDFNKMVHDLAGIESLRTDFVNNVSHEFRTPLASINGFASLLQGDGLTQEERAEYTQIIVDETRRLSTLASDILNLSRLENQAIVTDKAPFSLDEQLRRAIVMQEPTWSAKGLDMQVELDPVTFYGNEELLYPVWTNLLSNAIKFTEAGGSIFVRLIDAEDAAIVRVKDTGIGMDDATLRLAFDKFFQGDASHASGGAGLGLPLVKRVVDLCGGSVAVKSEPGKGSTFSVNLPLAPKATRSVQKNT